MNDRIRALAEQAEEWADNQNFYESDYRDYLMEKFAELIVKECASVVAEHFDSSEPWITPKTILYHFGVE
jgi:hypothetical protein